MPFFCFIVYNGHTLCLSNVISPINVSGKFTLENASLYEDLTYCTCTCFVLFHIKCVDMSIFLHRGMLNNSGITQKALHRDLRCQDSVFLDRASKWTALDCLWLKQMLCYSLAFFPLLARYSWSLSAMHRGSSVRVTVTCHSLSNHISGRRGKKEERNLLSCADEGTCLTL